MPITRRSHALTAFAAMVVTSTVLTGCSGGSPSYQTYKDACGWLSVSGCDDWPQDSVETFTEGNCSRLATPGVPGGIGPSWASNADSMKITAAKLWAYCPDAVDNFLAEAVKARSELLPVGQLIVSTLSAHENDRRS